ncbi:MAG: STAS domain-containing protein [Solirubrobacterales bacterium]
MPALAGLLITVGAGAIKPAQIMAVTRTEPLQTAIMAVTFVLTVLIPLQYAVLAGVGLAVILHVVGQSNRLVLRQLETSPDGRVPESTVPEHLGQDEVIVLQPYGSLFFASAAVFEAQLPTVDTATERSVVIVRLRGIDHLGLGLIDVLDRYARRLANRGSKLMIVCNNSAIVDQIGRAGLTADLGEEKVYRGTEWIGEAVPRAHHDATEWIDRTR